jgi:hypothetical protein
MSTAELIFGHASHYYVAVDEEDAMSQSLKTMAENQMGVLGLSLKFFTAIQIGRLLIALEETLAAFERGEDDEDVMVDEEVLQNLIPPTRELIALLRKWGYSEEDADLNRHPG